MKAIVFHACGGPDVLRVEDVAEPHLAQNSVLVRIAAAAVNPADVAIREGMAVHFDTWFPVTPGWDMAGTVVRVGDGVTEFEAGDEVIGYLYSDILHFGAYAEFAVAPVDRLARKPSGLSWTQAAALPLAGLTALQALRSLRLKQDERLLIHGIGGAVGSMAAQLATHYGARVGGTASPRHADYARSLKATVFGYDDLESPEVTLWAPDGVNAVFDCRGRGVVARSASLQREPGRTVSIADRGPGVRTVYARPRSEDLLLVVSLADQGVLSPRVGAALPLNRAAEAHELVASGGVSGKVVLSIE